MSSTLYCKPPQFKEDKIYSKQVSRLWNLLFFLSRGNSNNSIDEKTSENFGASQSVLHSKINLHSSEVNEKYYFFVMSACCEEVDSNISD